MSLVNEIGIFVSCENKFSENDTKSYKKKCMAGCTHDRHCRDRRKYKRKAQFQNIHFTREI